MNTDLIKEVKEDLGLFNTTRETNIESLIELVEKQQQELNNLRRHADDFIYGESEQGSTFIESLKKDQEYNIYYLKEFRSRISKESWIYRELNMRISNSEKLRKGFA